jgi:hypothetical protein
LIHERRDGRRSPHASGHRIEDDGIGPSLYRDRRRVIVIEVREEGIVLLGLSVAMLEAKWACPAEIDAVSDLA